MEECAEPLHSCPGLTVGQAITGSWTLGCSFSSQHTTAPMCLPQGSAGDQPGGVGQAEPLGQGSACAQQCPTNEQLHEVLTHLVLTQQPCWTLPARSRCHWDRALPSHGDSPGQEPREHRPPGHSRGVPDTAHFSLPFSKTKENGSGVNPCWVLN